MGCRYLLRRCMTAGCAEWSLLLMLALLKEKQLMQFARARPDVWEQCVEDVLESTKWERWMGVRSSEELKRVIGTVQQTLQSKLILLPVCSIQQHSPLSFLHSILT